MGDAVLPLADPGGYRHRGPWRPTGRLYLGVTVTPLRKSVFRSGLEPVIAACDRLRMTTITIEQLQAEIEKLVRAHLVAQRAAATAAVERAFDAATAPGTARADLGSPPATVRGGGRGRKALRGRSGAPGGDHGGDRSPRLLYRLGLSARDRLPLAS